MVAVTFHKPRSGRVWDQIAKARSVTKRRSRPLARHLADHGYTMIGLGLFDASCFVHSLFCGLMVSGISFIVFEFKVSGE